MALKPFYRALRGILRVFTPRMRTIWETPCDGEACVLCPNHERAWGPIDMCVHYDHRDVIHPWYNAGVIDRKGLPAYVRNDSWWNPRSLLAPLYNATIPYLASWILPPVIRSTPGIPVYYDTHVLQTFRDSVEVLRQGEQVVIFAQFPNGYQSHAEELSRGFVMIAPFAWRRLGLRLKFYPVHVSQKERTIRVMSPVVFNPDAPWEEEQERLLRELGEKVRD
ncbi:MAG: hypothetical protein IKP40_11205 [Clostridia bacterium]|nr:hypothetical protein [Clostridia bacterium]